MQRLFSTFPNSWPGYGILFLRLAAGLPLVFGTIPPFSAALSALTSTLQIAVHGIGVLLVIGLWTPFAAALQLVIETWIAASTGVLDQRHSVSAVIGLSLAMLGPGAWSVDAHLFGRKRIDFD